MTPSRRSRSRKSRIAPGSQRIPRLVFANYSQEDVAELIARYKAAALQPQPSAPVVDADLAVDNDSRPVSPANHRQPARFWISSPKSPARFPSNKITTSKYTLLTFLPKNLFEQFRRVANLFFLTVAILQFFPDYQVIDPVVAALPFIFIIAITALKDAIEDLRRHQSDERMNGLPVRVARSPEWFNSNQPFFEEPPQHWATSRNKQKQRRTECTTEPPHDLDPRWVEISWGNVQIGDIVLIQNDDPIPADLIILSSSEPDCLCYVETKNLDGETNLKIRQGLEETAFLSRGDIRMLFEEGTSRTRRFGERMEETTDDEKPRRLFRVAIEMEDPNPSLYTFSGAVLVSWDSLEWMKKQARRNTDQAVTDFDGTKPENNRDLVSVKIPLGINEMLLRGCILRNTDWVIGLVVYAGPEAKICLNSDKTPSKQSRIDIQMNPQVMTNLFILFLMCFFNALLSFVWENRQLPPLRDKFVPWLESSYPAASISRSNIGYAVFVSFWSSVLAYQNIVPISLYITVELVKSLQAYFIFSDLNMYHDETDQPCLPRSWNLADDLGQIDYIFSDKTGTLTQNIMQFKKCSINGTIYGIGVHYANAAHERESAMKMSQDLEKPIDMRVSEARSFATVVGGSRRSLGVTSLTEIALRKSTRESRPLVVEGTVDRQSEKRDFHNRQDKHRATWSEWNFGPWRYKKKSGVAEFRAEATLFGKPKVTENKIEKKSEATSSPPLSGSHAHHCAEDLQFSDPLLTNRLGDPTSDHYTALRDFFTCLSVCHSVLVSESPVDGGLRYMAQSPDEAALVQAARDVGISFVKRGPGSMTVDALGEIEESALLNVLEFNSTRKRMSIIVRRPAGEIVLYCKGADNVIYNLLASGQEAMKEITAGHLEQFAEEGLRTLCIAYAVLSEEKYTKWAAKYHEASTAITDRASKMDEAAQEIEENLVLIGATAIEDKLQEGVPQCIAHLLQAQIKIWVLTGDKMETAINIGFSCNLLAKDMILILIRGFEPGSTNDTGPADITCQQIREALKRFFGPDDDSQMSCGRRSRNDDSGHPENAPLKPPDSRKYALVIEGSALEQALQPDNRDIFLELGTRCSAVICCRVSPLQKARVVDLVRARKEAMCLAIGDGANDVSMIQAAQIGVGIAGEEGLQAVMASDYAIGQFRFLERLLLIHGHWSFVRTSEMILNFFFKNIIWVLILYWFQFYCGFSSEMIYEVSYMILYNVLFTALPVAVIGVLDQDVDEFRLAAAPQLLKSVQAAKPFSFFPLWNVHWLCCVPVARDFLCCVFHILRRPFGSDRQSCGQKRLCSNLGYLYNSERRLICDCQCSFVERPWCEHRWSIHCYRVHILKLLLRPSVCRLFSGSAIPFLDGQYFG
ncbi:hypothetical protein DFJ73DRAFT_85001 [Zopfochytrium polystomum]|nr:hypothetical protein DFJ73DRAFT_85001 [Zopfochytrium polystomum]